MNRLRGPWSLIRRYRSKLLIIWSTCLISLIGHCKKALWTLEHTKNLLTHWGRVTHICVSKLTIIGSDNGLSPVRRQTIIWTNAGILLIGTLERNVSVILSEIPAFSFKKMYLKVSSGKWRSCCLGLNVLKQLCKPKFNVSQTVWSNKSRRQTRKIRKSNYVF